MGNFDNAAATTFGCCARQVMAALQARGIDPEPFLAEAGIVSDELFRRDRRIHALEEARIPQIIRCALGDSSLGFSLGTIATTSETGLPYYLLKSSPTLRHAIMIFGDFGSLVNQSVIPTVCVKEGRQLSIAFRYYCVKRRCLSHVVEYYIAFIVKLLRDIGGSNVSPVRVAFSHSRSLGVVEFERFFGCSVQFDATVDELVFGSDTLDLPASNSDPILLPILRGLAQDMMAKVGLDSSSWPRLRFFRRQSTHQFFLLRRGEDIASDIDP